MRSVNLHFLDIPSLAGLFTYSYKRKTIKTPLGECVKASQMIVKSCKAPPRTSMKLQASQANPEGQKRSWRARVPTHRASSAAERCPRGLREHLPNGDGGDFVVFDARNGEAQELAFQAERYGMSGVEELDGFNLDACGQFHADGLRAERVDRLHPAVIRVGVGVVEQVNGVAGGASPRRTFR